MLSDQLQEEEREQEQQEPATSAAGPNTAQQQFNVAEGEVSSVSLGLSDMTRTENSDEDPTPGE
jgi:hypothetical protein